MSPFLPEEKLAFQAWALGAPGGQCVGTAALGLPGVCRAYRARMTHLVLGMVLGAVATAAVGAGVAAWALRKYLALERRTAQSERLAELGMLTGGLAHEIKNPLSTLQLNLQLLREDLERRAQELKPDDEAQRPGIDRMVRRLGSVNNEANRLREILDDFLRYAGRLELEPQPTDLVELLEELTDFLAPQVQLAKVHLAVNAGPDAPTRAEVDGKILKQALLNLLLNAIQHTPPGGSVTLRLAPDTLEHPHRRAVRIDVADTGRGIAPEEQPRVFEPYFSRRKGGTGLGLPMTRRIIEAHRGRIGLHSVPGRGSTFSLVLPLDADKVKG